MRIMFRDFSNIDYLKEGSAIQQKGWEVLTASGLLTILKPFHPILTGTLPLDIFLEGKSDLDISCEVYNDEAFISIIKEFFSDCPHFAIRQKKLGSVPSTIINFNMDDFPVEVVSQPLPILKQVAVQNLKIEYTILQQHDDSFKEHIMELKRKGLKTEPAFAELLHLKGDPYEALLNLMGELKRKQQPYGYRY